MQLSHAFKNPVIKFADEILSFVDETGEAILMTLPVEARVQLFSVLGNDVSKQLAAHGINIPGLAQNVEAAQPAATETADASAAARLAADPSGYFTQPDPTTTSAPEATAAVEAVQQ